MRKVWLVPLLGTLAVAALLAAVVSPPTPGEQADAMALQQPQPGDYAEYAVGYVGAPGPPMSVRVERLQDTSILGPDGSPIDVRATRETTTWVDEDRIRESWAEIYDADSLVASLVLAGIERSGGWSTRFVSVNAGIFSQSPPRIDTSTTWLAYTDAGHCGLRGLDADQASISLGHCQAVLRPIAVATYEGAQAAIYADAVDPERVQVWMDERSPFPAQVVRQTPDGLVGWQRVDAGRAEPLAARTEQRISLTPPAAAPAMEGRPDATGFDLPFSLDDALAVVGSHEDAWALRSFMQRPGTYIQWAKHHAAQESEFTVHHWDIQWSDGSGSRAAQISRDIPNEDNPLPFDPLDMDRVTGSVDDVVMLDATPPGPAKSRLPYELPSVGDMARLWEQGNDGTSTAYAFGHECADATCQEVVSWVGAGRMTVASDFHRYGFVGAPGALPENETATVHGSLIQATSSGLHGNVAVKQVRTVKEPGAIAVIQGEYEPGSVPRQPTPTLEAAQQPLMFVAATAALSAVVVTVILARGGGLAALFSRIQGMDLERHPARQGILEALRATPGIPHSVLQRQLGLAPGTLQHHLSKLIAAGLVVRKRNGQTRYHVPSDASKANLPEAQLGTTQARVLEAARQRPGATIQGLADACGIAQSTASYHARRLAAAGLIDLRGEGRTTRAWPSAAAPNDGD